MRFLATAVQKLQPEQTDTLTDRRTDRHTDRQTDSDEIITYPHTDGDKVTR